MSNVCITVCAFMLMAINSGSSWPFGIILPELVKGFQCSTSEAAITGAIQQGLLLGSAVFAGGLVDLFDCHVVAMAGSGLAALGMMSSYFVTSVYQLYITTGILSGFGMSLQFISVPVAIHRNLAPSKRTICMGVVMSGGGFGTFVYSPLCRLLMDEYGWRGMYLILSAIMFNCIPLSIPLRTRRVTKTPGNYNIGVSSNDLAPESKYLPHSIPAYVCSEVKGYLTKIFQFSLQRNAPFRYLLLSVFLLALGMQMPYMYLPSKAGVFGVSPLQASMLIAVVGLTDTVGRITFGVLATWYSSFFLVILGDIALGILHIASYYCREFYPMLVYTLLYGFIFGNHATLYMIAGPELLGVDEAAKSIGITCSLIAVAVCTTPSVGAYLWEATRDPGIPFIYAGCTAICAGLVLVICMIRHSDRITIRKNRSPTMGRPEDTTEPIT